MRHRGGVHPGHEVAAPAVQLPGHDRLQPSDEQLQRLATVVRLVYVIALHDVIVSSERYAKRSPADVTVGDVRLRADIASRSDDAVTSAADVMTIVSCDVIACFPLERQ